MQQFSQMMTQQMTAMQSQYEAHMKQQNDEHRAQMQLVIQQLRGTAMNGHEHQQGRRLDTKAFQKIDKFTGANRKDWSFSFKSVARSMSEEMFDILPWAER